MRLPAAALIPMTFIATLGGILLEAGAASVACTPGAVAEAQAPPPAPSPMDDLFKGHERLAAVVASC